jgi:hypothetical protein
MRVIICALLVTLAIAAPVENTLQLSAQNDVTCIICEELVGAAEKELSSNSTEEAIKNAIQQACTLASHIPGAQQVCDFAEANIEQIISLLTAKLSPDEVCKLLNQCANVNPVVKAPVAIDTCSTCEELVQILEYEVQQNATIQEIQALVGKVCDIITKYIPEAATECQFVQDNIATLIGLITSEVTPQEICTLVGQCSSKAKSHPFVRQHVAVDYCDTCKELLTLAETELQQNATQAEIQQLIHQACVFIDQYVPEVADECQMIEDNSAALIDELINEVSPEEACTLIGACSGKAIPAIARALRAHSII